MTREIDSAGLPQTRAKAAGVVRERLRYGFGRTSIAAMLVAASDKGVIAIIISEHADNSALIAILKGRFPRADLHHDPAGMRQAVDAVIDFVEEPRRDIALTLDVRGTAFQRRVWAAVMEVPFAMRTTFAAIARTIGAPRAVRAVGNACSRNPLEFAMPCHRVMRSDGSYSGGSAWGDLRQATIVRREAESVGEQAAASAAALKRKGKP
jgi:AraC family transcriptional regulator of adaptative response/methylated-DNA-[protein]-cysteine methyltransferase